MNFKHTAVLLGLAAITLAAGAQTGARKAYIVQLADQPLAAYTGGVNGFAPTRPTGGTKFDARSNASRAYLGYLDARRNQALAQAPAAPVLHRYNVAFNGFTALLTPAEVQKLASTAGVVSVTPDEPRAMDTSRTPAFLGLSTPGGLWSQLDAAGRLVKGEDIIVGIVDGGIWPENPSFSDKVDSTGKPIPAYQAGTVVYGPPPAKWHGTCQTGEGFKASDCNNKLIGAQYFNATFNITGLTLDGSDYVSPRDQSGHGDHTASTAAGNSGVDAFVNGQLMGQISGMAPRARIAAYKVCWTYVAPSEPSGNKNSCFTSDSVAAIDKAVADGVDVINYSISGAQTNFLDPVEVAFFNASAAGVFVAASAGNSGPADTVAHMSPWLTTVAASTHDRLFTATLTLGNGQQFTGPSLSRGLPSSPIVNATAVAMAGAAPADAQRCFPGTLDPALAAGKIVVCDRGVNARVEKSQTVKLAGGVGMVLLNTPGGAADLADDAHFVPSVHLPASAYTAIHSYASQVGSTAAIGVGAQTPGVVAPVMADFSSRGPNLANAEILKPDIAAPGVSILAAFAYQPTAAEHEGIVNGSFVPPGASDFLQGTSMASPHIAGIGALLRQLHPSWSPAAIKSAIMTSAVPVKLPSGAVDPDRWGYGAGNVNPNGAASPGLVYDAGPVDYLQFLCGAGVLDSASSTCTNFGSIATHNLNLASLTADVVGKVTMQRTVTNVGNASATYSASASLPGFAVSVSPSVLTLAPGQSGSFSVNLTRTSAKVNDWTFGNLLWSDGTHRVQSPLTARASLLSAPGEISDSRLAGAKVFRVSTGYAGRFSVSKSGLDPAMVRAGSVAKDDATCFDFNVPAGALHARFALYDSETSGEGQDDLDLEVYAGSALVGSSGGVTANEQVDLPRPGAGAYQACVIGYAPKGGLSNFKLFAWVVGEHDNGAHLIAAAPSRVFLGGTATVAAAWVVRPGQRYLGALVYHDGTGAAIGSTLLSVDTSDVVIQQKHRGSEGRKGLHTAHR